MNMRLVYKGVGYVCRLLITYSDESVGGLEPRIHQRDRPIRALNNVSNPALPHAPWSGLRRLGSPQQLRLGV